MIERMGQLYDTNCLINHNNNNKMNMGPIWDNFWNYMMSDNLEIGLLSLFTCVATVSVLFLFFVMYPLFYAFILIL